MNAHPEGLPPRAADLSQGPRVILWTGMVLAFLATLVVVLTSAPSDEAGGVSPLRLATPSSPMPVAAQAIVERLRAEIIPAENASTSYGVSFNKAGFDTLVGMSRSIALTEQQRRDFVGLRVRLPCCGFEQTLPEEEKNCACGHHLAMYGVAKLLLSQGWERSAVQQELDRWARYFYPREALAAELQRRAALDPEVARALEELKAKGGC